MGRPATPLKAATLHPSRVIRRRPIREKAIKALIVVAATLLAACDGSYPVAEECAAGRVCIEVWQEGEEVSFQITNNTDDMVTLPEFTALGAPMDPHAIELSSDKPRVDAPVRSAGFPVPGLRNDTVLRPRGWAGFALPAEGVRKAYRLSEDCQNVNVAYRINEGGAQYFLGSVQGGSA